MKKTIFVIALLFCALVSFTSCNGCGKGEKEQTDSIKVDTVGLVLENTVSLDRETMFAQYSENFCWYESEIIMKEYLDEDCSGAIESVTNVFQTLDENDDPRVYRFTHTADTTIVKVDFGWWCEDVILDGEEINLTFVEAFEKAMTSDAVKPHSRCCTLREPLGPNVINPQYIFGNVNAQLYVDATTGDVVTENPAFKGFTAK